VAVEVDLERKGKPGCQADVDHAQVGIEKVEVEHTLNSASVDQTRPVLSMDQPEAWAAFHAAGDADQPIVDGRCRSSASTSRSLRRVPWR
jgi:hypothetical protein